MVDTNSRNIKVQKQRVVMFVIDWNLAKNLVKTNCVPERKKMDFENFTIGALKKKSSD